MLKKQLLLSSIYSLGLALALTGQEQSAHQDKFRQLYQELPTPNVYRTASGAPGHQYWQQQADYKIAIELDDDQQRIYGQETVTYHNSSPDPLEYLWVQLDQNMRAKESDTYKIRTNSMSERMSLEELRALEPSFDGGFKLEYVRDANGQPLQYAVVKTMMRINLPKPLLPDKAEYQQYLQRLGPAEQELLAAGKNYYELTFRNIGGLVMPIILRFEFADGTAEEHRIPAEIWRLNSDQVSKVFVTTKEIQQIIMDPYLETADTDVSNNYYPPRQQLDRFELFRKRNERWDTPGENPMQRSRREQQPKSGKD